MSMNAMDENVISANIKKITIQTILEAWKDKWGEIPSITITNTDEAWVMLIVSKKSKIRLSFMSSDYKELFRHVFKLGNDPLFYPSRKNIYSNISEQIKSLRKSSKITQATLASALGVSQSTIADWESGVAKVSDDSLNRIKNVIQTISDQTVTFHLPKKNKKVNFIEEETISIP